MADVVRLTEDRSRHAVRVVGKQSSGLRILAVGVIVVAALYCGGEVFVPLAVVIPLSFARGPFVMLLRRKLLDAKIFVGFWGALLGHPERLGFVIGEARGIHLRQVVCESVRAVPASRRRKLRA